MYGKVFGRLTVISSNAMVRVEGKAHKRKKYWLCRCACGLEKYVAGSRLNEGKTKSCGCLAVEVKRRKHPDSLASNPPLKRTYSSYYNMLSRCYNEKVPNYDDYGGRGITVCDRWRGSFENFLEDMGIRPENRSIGRKDNNGNYEPDNCRWETTRQQSLNKRTTAKVRHGGTMKKIANLASKVGIPTGILNSRIRNGWEVEKAISTPVNHYKQEVITVTYEGKEEILNDLCVRLGMRYGLLRLRIKAGWDLHRAMYTPVSKSHEDGTFHMENTKGERLPNDAVYIPPNISATDPIDMSQQETKPIVSRLKGQWSPK